MQRAPHAVGLVTLAGVLIFATGACGGSGPTPAPSFRGTWFVSALNGEGGPPSSSNTTFGTLTADGLGMVTALDALENDEGVITPVLAGTITYAIGAGGVLAFSVGGMPALQGGVTSARDLAILAPIVPSNPGIVLLSRRTGTFGNASLLGTYHVCEMFDAVGGTDGGDGAFWGTATFDGAGHVTHAVGINTDGVVNPGPVPLLETYGVEADGTITTTVSGQTWQGGVLLGGDVAFVAGGIGAGGVRAVTAFIRASAAASAATFRGAYHVVALEAEAGLAPLVNWSSVSGTGTADGVGTFTVDGATVVSDDGTATPVAGPLAVPYTVAPDGQMGLTAGSTARGGISPDGRVAVLAGGLANLEDLVFWVFLRQEPVPE